MPAVLTLSFDPVVRLGDASSVRLETLVLAAVLFAGFVLAVRIGKLAPAPGLRIDDLVFMVVGAVPGAVVGGRLGYVLDHLAFYQANPSLIADPGQGGFTLTLAVPLGMLTGAIIGRLLGTPIGRWMHALALPLLFVLGAGKLAGVLGGTGQGAPTDLAWATAYVGPGPWGSLAAELPSHPSQVYEGALVGLAMLALWPLSRLQLIRRGTGAAIWAAVLLWCVVRFFVAFTWRDPAVVAGLGMEQLLAVAVGAVSIVGLVERARRTPREPDAPSEPTLGAAPITALEPAPVPSDGESEDTVSAEPEVPPVAAPVVRSATETDSPAPSEPSAKQAALWDVSEAEAEASAEPAHAAPKPRRSGRGTRGRVS